jgi:signal transduction histidine kinase
VLDHGLPTALESLAIRCPLPVNVECDLGDGDPLPERVATAAYFVASEALANVGKYARATRVDIRLSHRDELAVIAIADDGIGGADSAGGTGLRGLADRVEALGGRLHVVSPPGQGTTLTAELPCPALAAQPDTR